MPEIDIRGVRINFEDRGAGSETVVFAHGLLWSSQLFEHQIDALTHRYRCIAFDFRGQGRTSVARDGYDMDTVTDDAAALIERLHGGPCHFVGHSMGGFVGLRLAIRRPALVRSLTLINSTADPQPFVEALQYRAMSVVVRWAGVGPVVDQAMATLFGRPFLEDPARASVRDIWRRRLLANDRVGAARAIGGVVSRRGVRDQLDRVVARTLIAAGELDAAVPAAAVDHLHQGIRSSTLVVIPGAGHTAPVEAPESVSHALTTFLDEQQAPR